MIKHCVVALMFVFGILAVSSCCFGGSLDEQNIYSAEGKISAIDTFRSTVIVKSLLIYPVIKYQDVTLFVGPNTKITSPDGSIDIFDFTIGTPVNVKYVNKNDVSEALLIAVTKAT
jgi:hypothetical protein